MENKMASMTHSELIRCITEPSLMKRLALAWTTESLEHLQLQ